MKNFHLPLPEKTYDELRAEANKENIPTTALAREAIDAYLKERRRAETDRAIAAYACAAAGTTQDLDPLLESAAVEFLIESESKPR